MNACLHGMQVIWRAEPLDRGDRAALVHYGKSQAGVDPPPIDHDRASSTLAVIAALLGAREMQVLSQASRSVVRVSSSSV
jgi:hypothetical protein